jgi:hypothetical protein
MSNREFTATRTMLANGFATAGAELLAYMGTSAALAAIPHSEPARYVVAGTLTEIVKLLPGAEAIREITTQGVTGTAPAAATVLTDERIAEIARKEGDENSHGFIFNKDGRYSVISFASAIEAQALAQPSQVAPPAGLDEREQLIWSMGRNSARLAHAGVTAEPANWNRPQERLPEAGKLVWVHRRWEYSGKTHEEVVLGKRFGNQPLVTNRHPSECTYWGANDHGTYSDVTVAGWAEIIPPSPAAQVPAAEVRAQALEEAAQACEAWGNAKVANWSDLGGEMLEDAKARAWDSIQCANAIRSLAHQSTADSANTGALGEKGADHA